MDRTDIVIEGSTATWDINLEGPINGSYIGTFRFRCYLTPTQQIAANRELRELLGPNPSFTPEHEAFLAFALTQLKYRVVSAPPFWTGGAHAGDIADENVISAVLNAATDAEVKYRAQLKNKGTDALAKAKAAAERMMAKQKEEDEDEGKDKEDGN